MRMLLINPPHPSIGSRIPHEHLPPLGLLSIGGPLIDAGHDVELVDAEFGPMSTDAIVRHALNVAPDAILLGHSGSTSAHPVIAELTLSLKAALPRATIIYGGVYPTFSWERILAEEPQINIIVRGEAEQTVVRLAEALQQGTPLEDVPGLAFCRGGTPTATPDPPHLVDLDSARVGWELIDHTRYTYWGKRRAVVVQFSRGCPHRCSYCGQRGFWKRWRHRDPVAFAAEIAHLYRSQGVEVFNLADENPTASKSAWRAFLEALIAENVPVILVGSTRADDIVRDADILHLYKEAGVDRLLLGIENYDEGTLEKINKGGTVAMDRQAIHLLRQHKILSMATYVVGFEEERDTDYLHGLRKLLSYDPDQIQLLYISPHHWTPFAGDEAGRKVLHTDLRKWDYKHQVLATRHVPPWRVLLWVKLIEVTLQARPKAIGRLIAYPDKRIRAAMRWYYNIGRKVWPYELCGFILHDKRLRNGPTLAEFQAGATVQHDALRTPRELTSLWAPAASTCQQAS